MDQMFAKWGGGEVLRRAVKGMLPKNRLQDGRLARLKSKFALADPPVPTKESLLTRTRIIATFFSNLLALANIEPRSFRGRRPPVQGQYRQVRQPISDWQPVRSSGGVQGRGYQTHRIEHIPLLLFCHLPGRTLTGSCLSVFYFPAML